LFLVSLASYRKHRTMKLVFICCAFFVFFLQGIMMTLGIFFPRYAFFVSPVFLGLCTLVVLIFLFLAIVKR